MSGKKVQQSIKPPAVRKTGGNMEHVVGNMDELYDMCMEEDDCDRSFATPLRRLAWRIEDLLSRRTVLMATGDMTKESLRYPESELRHIIPEQIKSLSTVEDAIGLAKEDLHDRFGICWAENETHEYYMEENENVADASDDIIGGFIQLSFNEFDLIKGGLAA